jgi:CubicO group peptidase (beta-lactamase class C family)
MSVVIKLILILFLLTHQTNPGVYAQNQGLEKVDVCHDSLKPLLEKAIRSNSDALLVIQEDKIKCEWYTEEDKPIQLMSVTKSIVGLGVGSLLYEGYIDSLNQAIHHFYPEWNQGRKKEITIQHILSHTSGIQNVPNTRAEINPSKDVVQLALAAELSSAPGKKFSYNNKAVNLLAGIFEKSTGLTMDQYIDKYLFEQLEISDFEWQQDESGNPYAMAGLALKGEDLAKIGKLLLNNGIWGDNRLIAQEYIDGITNTQHEHGAANLWWKVPEYQTFTLTSSKLNELEERGIDKKIIWKLSHIENQPIHGRGELMQKLSNMFGPELASVRQEVMSDPDTQLFELQKGEDAAYAAEGYLGQYLMIIPDEQVVVVRLVEWKKSYNPETDGMNDFRESVLNLFK